MDFDPSYTAQQFKSVGTRPLRPDGVDKVTGRARYGADFNMPGQLVGRVLRSPHAHAIIRKIDTSKAEALKGVKAVVTAADLPDLTDGDADLYAILSNCMARDKAFYDGHAVAAVAAIDARIEARYHRQLADGFLDEVRALAARPEGLSHTAAQALGYKELLAHVHGTATLEEALQLAVVRTRRFARRQQRWFRRDPRLRWIDAGAAADNPLAVATALLGDWTAS